MPTIHLSEVEYRAQLHSPLPPREGQANWACACGGWDYLPADGSVALLEAWSHHLVAGITSPAEAENEAVCDACGGKLRQSGSYGQHRAVHVMTGEGRCPPPRPEEPF